MSEYTIFIKRIGTVGTVQTIAALRGLIILPILTRTLGSSGYGIWAQILVAVLLLLPLAQLGMDSAIVRFLPAETERRKVAQGIFTALSIILLTSMVLSCLVFLSSDFLAISLLHDESAAPLIKVASPLIILTALNATALNSFRIFGQIKRYSIIVLLQTFLEVGLVWFLVLSGYGLLGAILSLLITGAAILLVTLYLVISHTGFAFPNFSLLRRYLAYGLPLVPTVLFVVVTSLSDRYVIGFFEGAGSVGIYSAVYGIATIITMLAHYIVYILTPTIFRLYDESKIDEVKTYLSYSWKYLLMLSIPSAFGLSILARPLLSSLTTPEFVFLGGAVAPFIALGMLFYSMEGLLRAVLLLFKLTKILAITFGAAGAMNLVLNIIFVPHFGIIAAAITTLISYAMVVAIMYYKSRQYIKFNINLNFIIKSILSSAVMTLAIWALSPIGAVKILFSIAIGIIIYFGVLFLLKGFEREELRLISEALGLKRLYEIAIRK